MKMERYIGARRAAALTLLLALVVTAAPVSFARAETYYGEPIAIPPSFVPMQPPTQSELDAFSQAAEIVTAGPELTELGQRRLQETSAQSRGGRSLAPIPAAVDNSALKYFPPIGDQGSLGSCASFANTYYMFTYMTAWERDIDVKAVGDSAIFSPSFAHNASHGAITFAQTHGALTLAQFPYNQNDEITLPAQASVWREALKNKGDKIIALKVDTAEELSVLKEYLYNGYIFTFSTDVYGWYALPVKNDPSLGYVCYYNGSSHNHQMTIVGYNDDIWMDKNGNNVVDTGELGALKIANSWGNTSLHWKDGFAWLSYSALDALYTYNQQSAATLTARKEEYTATLLAELEIDVANRQRIYCHLGFSAPGTKFSWGENMIFFYGAFPYSGALVYDFANTVIENNLNLQTTLYDLYVLLYDFQPLISGLHIKSFKLTDGNGGVLAVGEIPPPHLEQGVLLNELKITYGRTDIPAGHWVVNWDTNGGVPEPACDIIPDGGVIDAPPDAARDGYDLKGWYLNAACTQSAKFPMTVNSDITLYAKWIRHYGGDSTYLVPDVNNDGWYIDLDTETFVTDAPFPIAAYSIDGGVKWKKGVPKLPSVLNKISTLVLADHYDSKAKRPAEGSTVVQFPAIAARPKANPNRLIINYALCADQTGATPGGWTLAKKGGLEALTDGIEIAPSRDKKKPDVQPDGSTWFAIPDEGVPVQPYGSAKQTYIARTAPVTENGLYVPASKLFKLTPKAEQKPANYRVSKGVFKLKAGARAFGGGLDELRAAGVPQWAASAALFAPGLFYKATVADKKSGVPLPGSQKVCLWTPAAEKKPASKIQEVTVITA